MSERRLTYTFGPLERRGLFGGIATGQLGVLLAGAATAILLLDHLPSAGGAAGALIVCASAAAVAFAPVGGRPVCEWAPVGGTYLLARISGRHRFRSRTPVAGVTASGLGSQRLRLRRERPELPRALNGVRILPAGEPRTVSGQPIGVLSEHGGRRLTAVLACRVAAFGLLDHEAQERRLARWGLVLSGAGGGAIRRLGWIERTAPAQGDELARWLHDERDPAIPLRGSAMVESYLELISASARVSQEHEVLIAIQVDGTRVRERGREAVTQALVESTERIAHGLEAAEVTVLGALGPGQLARTLRTAFDPFAHSELAALRAAAPDHEPGEGDAWPVGSRDAWDHYESDGARHATFWIAGWPRVEVSPMFMDALLGRSSAVRSVAVTFEPLAPDRSTREVEAAVTRDRADRELRARFGQSETARQRQAAAATIRREAELAAGHGEVRLSGFVTVSGRDPDELRRACGEVLEHAARARLELRRMYGQQAEAFTFTLPLCRGLR
jgi:hypothetical protein